MFRKAQLKFFGIITGILLAVFIAVLGSVNLIMRAVMERQSKITLKQIAEGVEYDDVTSTFTFIPPEHGNFKPDDEIPPKPAETTSETTTAPVTTSSITTTVTSTSTTAVNVPETSAVGISEPDAEPDTEPDADETDPEMPTVEPETPPTVTQPPVMYPPTEFPTDNYGGNGWMPPEGWGWRPGDHQDWQPDYPPPYGPPGDFDPFKQPHQQDQNNGSDRDDRYGDEHREGVSGTVNKDCGDSGIILLMNAASGQYDWKDNKKDGVMPKKDRPGAEPVPRSLGSMDFFIIRADDNGRYLASMNNDDLQQETAQKYIEKILDSKMETGTLNQYQFYQIDKDNGTLMVFTDKSAEIDMLNKLIRTTITIGIAAFLLLSVAAFFFSVQIVKPLKTAFEKQKQFVSDASHELKTPVTVISANADVLADEIGENKWLTYIKSQTERMNVLVNDLLNLTRLENNTADFMRVDFDLSRAVINTALPFECQAFETNKKFIVDVDDDITVNGSEKHIKQMTAIFIDNALKYSDDGGTVRVTLKKSGDKRLLTIFNTGKGIKESEKEKIFERFYRSDESRNRSTGGYGLGLAIAKSIIDKHRFKVSVETKEGESICFVVVM